MNTNHDCNVCGLTIPLGQDIHSDNSGEDCHADCCPVCQEEFDWATALAFAQPLDHYAPSAPLGGE